MRKVVIDHPLAPCELEPVPIESDARKHPGLHFVRGRRWIKGYPAINGEINFYPAVRIAFPDDVIAAEIVVLAGQEAGYVAGWDSDGAEHHGHRCCEVFAMTRATNKQKIGERVSSMRAGKIKRVGVM